MPTLGSLPPAKAARRWAAALALVAVAAGFSVSARAQSPLIQGWLAVNTQCKAGPADSPNVQKACKRRDELGARLERRHCVYQADGDWWRCPH